MRSISILGGLLIATIAVPAAAHGPSDEVSLCSSQVEFTHSCCNNPATCMTEEQGNLLTELDTKIEQNERSRAPANELAVLQKKVNSAAQDNCVNAVKNCVHACGGVDEDSVDECRHDKQNIELFKGQADNN